MLKSAVLLAGLLLPACNTSLEPTIDEPSAEGPSFAPDVPAGDEVAAPHTDVERPQSTVQPQGLPQEVPIPANEDDLLAYLMAGTYKELEAGPVVNAHGHGPGRTFFNASLASSIRAKATSHEKGAGSVKELFDANDELFGWTVAVKIGDVTDVADGAAWFWFEIHGTDELGHIIASGAGVGACKRCHVAGVDMVVAQPPK